MRSSRGRIRGAWRRLLLRWPPVLLGLALTACGDPPTFDVPTVVRGHQEVVARTDGTLLPLLLGTDSAPGLCLQVPAATDTSRWEARLLVDGRPSPTGFAPPAARMGRILCFDGSLPAGVCGSGERQLCAEVVDRFDDSRFLTPCRRIRCELRTASFMKLQEELAALLAARPSQPLMSFLDSLDELAHRARQRGYPLLAGRLALIAVYFLRREGDAEHRRRALARFEALPTWLREPEASGLAAQAAYERAWIELGPGGSLSRAWELLGEAEERYLKVAHPQRFTVAMAQAEILARVGAAQEAASRLRAALADCERSPCDPNLLPYGPGQLAWLLLLDPDASEAELAEAEAGLRQLLESLEPRREPLERANQLVNLAYLEVRRQHQPLAALAEARELLAAGEGGRARARRLLAWSELVEGLAALDAGDTATAMELCSRLMADPDPRLAAWAASCTGRSYRARGDLHAAARAFEQALLRHEYADAPGLGQGLPLGPGQRADDFARAARVAVHLGEPERAWRLLRRLDSLSTTEVARRRCRETVTEPALVERWRQLDGQIADLFAELVALEAPAAGPRRRQAEALSHTLKERLRDLWRQWPGCAQAPPVDDRGLRYRAVALEDEVLMLARDSHGRVTLEHCKPLPRRQLRAVVAQVGRVLSERDLSDAEWRRLLAPVASVLLPRRTADLPAVTPFALHGLLQGIPLAALPVPPGVGATDGGDEPRWLGDLTTVTLQPAGSRASAVPSEGGTPVFVVDPNENLAGAARLLPLYRRLFPTARMLSGSAATHGAVMASLPRTAWLHMDVHGRYDSAFPELSRLELADGALPLIELAELPAPQHFANLSGCRTGSWPFTADSGRYGMAGLLVRLGVDWVVGSRTDLDDAVAGDFNRVFYASVADGASVPEAYGRALATVRHRHPVGAWASLLLLQRAGATPAAATVWQHVDRTRERPRQETGAK